MSKKQGNKRYLKFSVTFKFEDEIRFEKFMRESFFDKKRHLFSTASFNKEGRKQFYKIKPLDKDTK